MICGRCLLPVEANRGGQRCLACEWTHAPGCDGKSCSAHPCAQPAWPECPAPNPEAAGERFVALQAQRAAAKLAKDLTAEKAQLSAELATIEPPEPEPEKSPEERAAEIKARLLEIDAELSK